MQKVSTIGNVKDGGNIKMIYVLGIFLLFAAAVFGIAYAAFSDRGDVRGTSVSVGSADIKLLQDLSLGASGTNLVDELAGPVFENIGQTWSQDYLVKLFNNSSSIVELSSTAYYETANDPSDLRQDIYVELLEWNDLDADGFVGVDEVGTNYGKKTIVKWKTEGFSLGQMNSGEIKGIIVRFSADSISDTKQGQTLLFDFGFDSVALE